MKKVDGSICKTTEENAAVFRDHFTQLYDRTPIFDSSVLDLLPQQPTVDDYDQMLTDEEITLAVTGLKNNAPGDSGSCPQAWKSLIENETTFEMLKGVIRYIWNNEIIPDEWNLGRLMILPKKGDLSLPKNYRGIMLLEVAYKIVARLLQSRLLPFQEALDHEPQCGFRPGRGCIDATFTVKIALKKRREHGQESWVFFLDLVKAFDRVPRELLWMVLKKFGVPEKLITLLKALHKNFEVKFTVDEVTQTLKCTIGVKQGDILGPTLFTFFIAAVMITWRATSSVPACIFRSKKDVVMTGRSYRAYGEEFSFQDSEYADDTAIIFESRYDLEIGVPLIMNHFVRFGMEVHSGPLQPREESKSVVLYCSKPPSMYKEADTYDNADLSDVILGRRYIPIVDEFVYLGTVINRDCTDEADVNRRIQKAGNAFGSLRKCLFSSTRIKPEVKGKVYETYILPILLYGAETWSLTETLLKNLRNFHHRCMRNMCLVNRHHTWIHRIRMEDLANRLTISSIDTYICRQQLRWAGHVIRMNWSRLPRKMFSCWVRSKRPIGAPKYTYGRSLFKALTKAGIDADQWCVLASDRNAWRKTISNLSIPFE